MLGLKPETQNEASIVKRNSYWIYGQILHWESCQRRVISIYSSRSGFCSQAPLQGPRGSVLAVRSYYSVRWVLSQLGCIIFSSLDGQAPREGKGHVIPLQLFPVRYSPSIMLFPLTSGILFDLFPLSYVIPIELCPFIYDSLQMSDFLKDCAEGTRNHDG